MRNKFEQEMAELNAEVIKMGEFITSTIKKAMQALKDNNKELAQEVYENDDIADALESSIESIALKILLTEQPVARDLRTISTALKMITDMERICDQAADIAKIVLGLEPMAEGEVSLLLYEMAEKSAIMVSKAVDAQVNRDLALAYAVIEADDEVDRLFAEIRQQLAEKNALMQQSTSESHLFIDYFTIAKYLERIGDHAQNIAEWVIFNITGEHKNKKIL